MESLEAILKMNEKHPPGRRSRCITDLCARVEELEKALNEERDERRRKASELIGGGPLTPGELEGDYVVRGAAGKQPHQPSPAPQPAPSEQTAGMDAPSTAEARSEAIRAIVARGDPVTAEMVMALCDEAERYQRQASLWADNIADLTRERDVLRAAIIRALDACPFCRQGECRAEAHRWLRDAVEGCQ